MDQATADTLYVNIGGDSMTGPLLVPDIGANTVSAYVAPTAPEHLTRKDYVDSVAGGGGSSEPETDAMGNTNFGINALPTPTSQNNTAIGQDALAAHTGSGNGNTAVGKGALDAYTGGGSVTAIGTDALGGMTRGNTTTAVGQGAGGTITEYYGCVFVGQGATSSLTGMTNGGTAIGSMAKTGNLGVAVGTNADADGDYAIAIGAYVVADGANSIGIGASTDGNIANQIMLGTATHATVIPGTLTVAGVPVLERLTQLMDIIEALERRITELEAKGHHRFPFGH